MRAGQPGGRLSGDPAWARRRRAAAWVLVCALLCVPGGAGATVVLGIHDWDQAGEGLMGWQSEYDSSALTRHGDGWFQIDFPEIPVDPGEAWYDLLWVEAENLFAGDWSDSMWIEFDFWADDVLPNDVAVQWQAADSDYVWSFTLNPSEVGSRDTFGAPFADWTDWVLGPGASEEKFLDDLAAIDWIGIYIFRTGTDAQMYGLDNWKLMIPEPAEYAMLAAALAAALACLRGRRKAVEAATRVPPTRAIRPPI